MSNLEPKQINKNYDNGFHAVKDFSLKIEDEEFIVLVRPSGKWTSVTSWNFSGTGNVFISKSYKGISGIKYRTKIVVTMDGEKAEATSETCKI